MSIDVMRSVPPPLPLPLVPPPLLQQMHPVNCGMLQTPAQGQWSQKSII